MSSRIDSSAHGSGRTSAKSQSAFTFLELIVVVAAIVLVLATVAVPAFAKSKSRTPAAGCQNNLRQLMATWAMYADEYNGRLMLNAPLGVPTTRCWCPPQAAWGAIQANTNVSMLLSSLMGRYYSNNVSVFRCPGDVVPSANGYRLRSYSMNGQLAPQEGQVNYGAPLKFYSQLADLGCPTPSKLFVFCDESMWTMSDGYFQVSPTPWFANMPAAYLDGGCGFSFADGHAEIHKWQGTNLLVPVVYNNSFIHGGPQVASNDVDWVWFSARTGCR
jgi:prepilin-type processing-associated H-X9-DG protein